MHTQLSFSLHPCFVLIFSTLREAIVNLMKLFHKPGGQLDFISYIQNIQLLHLNLTYRLSWHRPVNDGKGSPGMLWAKLAPQWHHLPIPSETVPSFTGYRSVMEWMKSLNFVILHLWVSKAMLIWTSADSELFRLENVCSCLTQFRGLDGFNGARDGQDMCHYLYCRTVIQSVNQNTSITTSSMPSRHGFSLPAGCPWAW